jgi:galactokinase
VFASARAIGEQEIRMWSSKGEKVIVQLGCRTPLTGDAYWANYVFGVVDKYHAAGHVSAGFEIAFDTNLPTGAGLSSSAAMEAATALIVEGLLGIELPVKERALLCQAAEHDWAGVPCGIMDQLAVNAGVEGHALRIDTRSLEIVPARLPKGLSVVVIDSKVKHALASGEYGKRRADCEAAAKALGVAALRDVTMDQLVAMKTQMDERIFRRARHVVTEIERVRAFTAALDLGDIEKVGELMAGSHDSLRDDFEVSCVELDRLVDMANDLGACGARMMGGGFGGSVVSLVPDEAAENFSEAIVALYYERHDEVVEAFVVHPVCGARREPSRQNDVNNSPF